MTSNELILRYALLECRAEAERATKGGWRHRVMKVVDKALYQVQNSVQHAGPSPPVTWPR